MKKVDTLYEPFLRMVLKIECTFLLETEAKVVKTKKSVKKYSIVSKSPTFCMYEVDLKIMVSFGLIKWIEGIFLNI